VAYSRGGHEKPAAAEAQKSFDGLLRNIRLENCQFRPDVVNALFHRLPAKVEAENYGHEGAGKSYYIKNSTENAERYRATEPVPIVSIPRANESGRSAGLAIQLKEGEWTAYTVNEMEGRNYDPVVRVKTESAPAALQFSLDDLSRETVVTNSDWAEIKVKTVALSKGPHRLKLEASRGTLLIDWVWFH
jgi:hypothetical protein